MKAKQPPPPGFYSINEDNQTELVFAPTYNQEAFDEIDKKYSWNNFEQYDNKLWQYRNYLLKPLYSLSESKLKSKSDFFNKLTRGQKVFKTFLVFDSQTDNGGVYQFLFNYPEYCFAALETMQELNMDKLAQDYEKCLGEFIASADKYVNTRANFGDERLSREERWAAFTAGYNEVVSGQVIEEYYYVKDYKMQLYKTVVDYIYNHFEQFVKKS